MYIHVPQDLASEGGEEEEDIALGDVVEEELAATSQAVEEAARKIQVTRLLCHPSIFPLPPILQHHPFLA